MQLAPCRPSRLTALLDKSEVITTATKYCAIETKIHRPTAKQNVQNVENVVNVTLQIDA